MQVLILLSLLTVGTYSAPYISYDLYRPQPQLFQKPVVSGSFGNGYWPNPLGLAPAYFRPFGYAAPAPVPAPAYVFAWPPSPADGNNAIGSTPYGYQYTVQLPSGSMEPPVYEFKDGLEDDTVVGEQEEDTFVDAYHKPSVVPMPPTYDGETPLEVQIPVVDAEQSDEEQVVSNVEDVNQEPKDPQVSAVEDDDQKVIMTETDSEDIGDRTGNQESVVQEEAVSQVANDDEKMTPVTEVPKAQLGSSEEVEKAVSSESKVVEEDAAMDAVQKTSEEDTVTVMPTEVPQVPEVSAATSADDVAIARESSEDYDESFFSVEPQSDKTTDGKVEEAMTESTLV